MPKGTSGRRSGSMKRNNGAGRSGSGIKTNSTRRASKRRKHQRPRLPARPPACLPVDLIASQPACPPACLPASPLACLPACLLWKRLNRWLKPESSLLLYSRALARYDGRCSFLIYQPFYSILLQYNITHPPAINPFRGINTQGLSSPGFDPLHINSP